MPILNARFRAEVGESLAKPYLDVNYINPHTGKNIRTRALIDTGADVCVLPSAYAEILGHNLEKGEPSDIMGVSGPVSLYKHTMQIEIEGFKTEEILISFNPYFHKPLIGVKTFLAHFILTVNYPAQHFSLQLPEVEENMSNWGTI